MLSLSHQVVSDCDPRMAAALQTRLPPLPPRACSNSCLLCWWCHPTISSSLTPFSSCLQSFPASGSCPMSWFFAPGDQNIRASSSASVLPMIIQGWFPLELTGWSRCCPKDSQESSPTSQFESTQPLALNSLALRLLYGPTLISVYDYWKSHRFDYMDLFLQSDAFGF